MIIIVEGPDGSGKDTFINNLSKLTGFKHIRGSSFEISKSGSDGMYEKWVRMLLEEDDVIINRFLFSNLVYGPMYGYPTITFEKAYELLMDINKRAIVFYINADRDIIMNRIKNRGDDDIDPEDIEGIQIRYEELWKKAEPENFIKIDSSDDSLLDIDSDVYKNVISKLNLKKGDFSG